MNYPTIAIAIVGKAMAQESAIEKRSHESMYKIKQRG